jgi:hypothetical protein
MCSDNTWGWLWFHCFPRRFQANFWIGSGNRPLPPLLKIVPALRNYHAAHPELPYMNLALEAVH